ncbi:DUF4142 domain-containing protein [Nonomuraea roseoviolacea]|uniref:Membrane protein n=1 Tax=Nonomuraea roseoviolacea subsp. carminata TaxID=160689 RepID=A0ABT1K177_9ACTN|nr:DUF4142 domain-containing protein [Nonomuraea roseoviolacea]MCP2347738.1 putative membrane protein [Nonomuraea roseoviolacea subsp. carminata]
MRRSHLSLLLVAVAAAATAGCGGGVTDSSASSGSSSASAPAAKASGQDRAWMRQIHLGGLARLQAAKLAQDKGSQDVKALGDTLVKDQGTLDEQLVRTAERHGVRLPTGLSNAQQKEAVALEKAAHARFDRRFVKEMAQSHKRAISSTKREIKKGSAPEIVALAKSTLPSLEHHLAMLREADDS